MIPFSKRKLNSSSVVWLLHSYITIAILLELYYSSYYYSYITIAITICDKFGFLFNEGDGTCVYWCPLGKSLICCCCRIGRWGRKISQVISIRPTVWTHLSVRLSASLLISAYMISLTFCNQTRSLNPTVCLSDHELKRYFSNFLQLDPQ